MTFDNLNALFGYIERNIQNTLENEVSETVKDAVSQSVNTSVYAVYEPKYYIRRMDNGGLSDKNNYSVEPVQNGIVVRNDTPLDNGRMSPRLDEIVVLGLGNMPSPRDFYSEGERILQVTKAHVFALKQGLRDRGIEVE